MEERIRIMLVDDHPLYRKGTAMALQQMNPRLDIVAEAGSLKEAKEKVDESETLDLVLLDLNLPDGNGAELLRYLKKVKSEVKVLVISVDLNPKHIVALIDEGINGFISKDVQAEELNEAINAVMLGMGYYGKIIMTLVDEVATAADEDISKMLTPRELEVMELCAQGMSAQEIAEKLFLSRRTIEWHKSHIFEKMGFKNIGELINYAFSHGILGS